MCDSYCALAGVSVAERGLQEGVDRSFANSVYKVDLGGGLS